MNPRTAINDLLPFQGSPFSLLGTSPGFIILQNHRIKLIKTSYIIVFRKSSGGVGISSGEDGIRTHVPLRTNGFQDRLVMTTSILLQFLFVP